MAKHFRPWKPKQKWLLPPEITEFIPEGHASHCIRNLVVEQLDLSAILGTYEEERGFATHTKNGKQGTLIESMREKRKRGGWRSPYRLRKQVVEPVFGQIKQAMGFRQFLLRGLAKVQAEWSLVCTAHNLLKRVRASA